MHPSQNSRIISLPTFATITGAAAVTSTSMRPGQTNCGVGSGASTGFVYIAIPSTSELIFLKKRDWHVDADGNTILRRSYNVPFTAYHGACQDPAAVIPQCKTVVIQNPDTNTGSVHIRKGTANGAGYTVAGYSDYLGDANAENVVGIFILPGGSYTMNHWEFSPGDELHMCGTSGEKIILHFN